MRVYTRVFAILFAICVLTQPFAVVFGQTVKTEIKSEDEIDDDLPISEMFSVFSEDIQTKIETREVVGFFYGLTTVLYRLTGHPYLKVAVLVTTASGLVYTTYNYVQNVVYRAYVIKMESMYKASTSTVTEDVIIIPVYVPKQHPIVVNTTTAPVNVSVCVETNDVLQASSENALVVNTFFQVPIFIEAVAHEVELPVCLHSDEPVITVKWVDMCLKKQTFSYVLHTCAKPFGAKPKNTCRPRHHQSADKLSKLYTEVVNAVLQHAHVQFVECTGFVVNTTIDVYYYFHELEYAGSIESAKNMTVDIAGAVSNAMSTAWSDYYPMIKDAVLTFPSTVNGWYTTVKDAVYTVYGWMPVWIVEFVHGNVYACAAFGLFVLLIIRITLEFIGGHCVAFLRKYFGTPFWLINWFVLKPLICIARIVWCLFKAVASFLSCCLCCARRKKKEIKVEEPSALNQDKKNALVRQLTRFQVDDMIRVFLASYKAAKSEKQFHNFHEREKVCETLTKIKSHIDSYVLQFFTHAKIEMQVENNNALNNNFNSVVMNVFYYKVKLYVHRNVTLDQTGVLVACATRMKAFEISSIKKENEEHRVSVVEVLYA